MKRASLLAVSLLLLVWLLRRVGGGELYDVLLGLDPLWLAAAFAMFVPTTLLSAWRWQVVAADVQSLSLGRALGMVLAASAANVLLPAKLGDVGKGAFLRAEAGASAGTGEGDAAPGGGRAEGLALALFEKLADVAALAVWMLAAAWAWPPEREAEQLACVLGLGIVAGFAVLCAVPLGGLAATRDFGPLSRAAAGVAALRAQPGRFVAVLVASLLLWGLHLLQFQLAAWAAGAEAAPALLASRIPMAIFVGLLPVSFAGIGTRDLALVYLLGPFLGEPVALALGAFATVRYLVPAAAGLFVVGERASSALS